MLPTLLHLVDDFLCFKHLLKHVCLIGAATLCDVFVYRRLCELCYLLTYLLTYLPTYLPTWKNDKKRADLIEVFKMISGLSTVKFDCFFEYDTYGCTWGH